MAAHGKHRCLLLDISTVETDVSSLDVILIILVISGLGIFSVTSSVVHKLDVTVFVLHLATIARIMGFWTSKPPSAPLDQSVTEPVAGAAVPIVQETKAEVVVAQGNDKTSSGGGGGTGAGGGCPMHRADGSYSFDVRALWRAGFPHAPGGSHPLTTTSEQAAAPAAARSAAQAPEPLPPVETTAPTTPSVTKPSSSGGGGGCPVKQKSNNKTAHPEYNVYAQAMDPTNQMPFQPNQLPAPTQSVPLSTERVASTIPKVRAWIVLIFAACVFVMLHRTQLTRSLVVVCALDPVDALRVTPPPP
jgi:hypothetical protein